MIRNGKYFYLLSLLFLIVSLPNTMAEDDNDKAYHFSISALLGFGAETLLHTHTEFSTLQRIFVGTGLATVPGLIKELIDDTEDDNEFDNDDMLANVGGALTGAVFSNYLHESVFIGIKRHPEKRIYVAWRCEF